MRKVVLLIEVVFVADQNNGQFLVGVVLGLVQPLGQVVVGLPTGDVVDQDSCDRPPVI